MKYSLNQDIYSDKKENKQRKKIFSIRTITAQKQTQKKNRLLKNHKLIFKKKEEGAARKKKAPKTRILLCRNDNYP